jgi:hypothetical protein
MPRALPQSDVIESRLAQHRRDLENLVTKLSTAHDAEREKLESRIKTLEDQIQADKDAKEAAEKAEGTGGTLVLPPERVPQAQEHGQEHGQEPAGRQEAPTEGKKGRGWKRGW